jgi:hypothetical protein
MMLHITNTTHLVLSCDLMRGPSVLGGAFDVTAAESPISGALIAPESRPDLPCGPGDFALKEW